MTPPRKMKKLTGDALAAYEELQQRLADAPNPRKAGGQARLLDVGIAAFAPRIPAAVIQLLDEAAPISVADATGRAGAAGKTWQDVKATLDLQVRLVRARAHWEKGKPDDAGLELKQVSASASSRRAELILAAADRTAPAWSPTFSLALLRSASSAFSNSHAAALCLVDALTGAGEQPAAALLLGQIIAGRALWPDLPAEALTERIGRLDPEHRAALVAALGAI